jgi:NADPH:quinone reductase-like Zn-dependent oxidoreductase
VKALLLDKTGPISDLRVGEAPVPEPGPGEIRVRVRAVSLNPVDYKLASRGHESWSWPHILGLDVAGEVDAVGESDGQWKIGDRVFYHGDLSKPGGFAEYAITTAHTTAAIPSGVGFNEAAAIPCAGLTAYEAVVRRLNVQAGQVVWVQGGAGGVGGFGIQICAAIGASVITTASARNHDFVTSLGATHAIDYSKEDVVGRIMEITRGRGVDGVLGAVDPVTSDQGVEVLAFRGGIACVAGLPTLTESTFAGAHSVHQVAYGGAHTSNNRAAQLDLARMAEEMIAMVAEKKIDPMVQQVIGLEDIPGGLAQLETRHVRGKIVAEIG